MLVYLMLFLLEILAEEVKEEMFGTVSKAESLIHVGHW